AYVAQFWPANQYDQTEIEIEVAGRAFAARGKVVTKPGWTVLYKNDVGNEDIAEDEDTLAADLRSIASGMAGQCLSASADQQETKPKPLYT
ncbi:DNA topoisomerase, partial [Acinetobacter baumannii]